MYSFFVLCVYIYLFIYINKYELHTYIYIYRLKQSRFYWPEWERVVISTTRTRISATKADFTKQASKKDRKLSHQDEGNGPTLSFEEETIGNDFVGVTCFFDVPPRTGMMLHNDELFQGAPQITQGFQIKGFNRDSTGIANHEALDPPDIQDTDGICCYRGEQKD